ncbi:ABC transporter ATP-binding protein [uncultured Sporomusa sp.]|uniref:ABC transporter ATP-binding protein n=2 Tax=uncultured Sporomusa sp. TaxID=307249 RepID=A0A212LV77_9FIRM|nr:ABC transporter ATP-binding protein [uncultured Sporomusa sp.]
MISMDQSREHPLLLLLAWAGKEKYKLYLAILCGLVSGLLVVVPYMAVYQVLELAYYQQLTGELLLMYGLTVAAAVAGRNLFLALGVALSHKGAYNALYRVRAMLVDHMAVVPLGSLSRQHTGEIKKVISEDIEKLELFLAHHLPEMALYAAGPVAIFLYLASVNWLLALITLLPLPAAVWLQYRLFAGYRRRMHEMNQVMAGLNAAMIEYISGMKLIKAYNLGVTSYRKYAGAIDAHHSLWQQIAYQMGPLFATFVIVLQCAAAAVVPAGGFLFVHGQAGAGVFILFVFVGSLYLLELRPLLELGSNFSQVLNGIHNAQKILAIPPLPPGGEAFPDRQDVEFRQVSFAYDGRNTVLKNVNFYIRSGEKFAFVGRSGAGKSTITQLIARFYDVGGGEVLIGGCNVRKLDYEALQKNIAIVFQQTFLTRQSVLENIRMGTTATLDEVKAAAKKAQIHDFIESLPAGYETKVGSYGSRFSGGEKQRIAIARAILKNAPLLVLDEATAAADPENEQAIQAALAELCAGRTVVIVAHRLDIVKKCDRIAVVENNTVTAVGTHEELLAVSGYYRQIWEDYTKSRSIAYGLKKTGEGDCHETQAVV